MTDRTIPDAIEDLVDAAVEARRHWLAQPTDRDHERRHRAQEVYATAEAALTRAVVAWVADEAATPVPSRLGGFTTAVRDPNARRTLRVGDIVAVKPSRPRRHDGWTGTIMRLVQFTDGRAEAEVSWPGGSPRSVAIARIGARKAAAS